MVKGRESWLELMASPSLGVEKIPSSFHQTFASWGLTAWNDLLLAERPVEPVTGVNRKLQQVALGFPILTMGRTFLCYGKIVTQLRQWACCQSTLALQQQAMAGVVPGQGWPKAGLVLWRRGVIC